MIKLSSTHGYVFLSDVIFEMKCQATLKYFTCVASLKNGWCCTACKVNRAKLKFYKEPKKISNLQCSVQLKHVFVEQNLID